MMIVLQRVKNIEKIHRRYRDRDWGRGKRTGQKDDITSGRTMKVSYAGEHDMEVRFDVEVDNQDVMLVNKVKAPGRSKKWPITRNFPFKQQIMPAFLQN